MHRLDNGLPHCFVYFLEMIVLCAGINGRGGIETMRDTRNITPKGKMEYFVERAKPVPEKLDDQSGMDKATPWKSSLLSELVVGATQNAANAIDLENRESSETQTYMTPEGRESSETETYMTPEGRESSETETYKAPEGRESSQTETHIDPENSESSGMETYMTPGKPESSLQKMTATLVQNDDGVQFNKLPAMTKRIFPFQVAVSITAPRSSQRSARIYLPLSAHMTVLDAFISATREYMRNDPDNDEIPFNIALAWNERLHCFVTVNAVGVNNRRRKAWFFTVRNYRNEIVYEARCLPDDDVILRPRSVVQLTFERKPRRSTKQSQNIRIKSSTLYI